MINTANAPVPLKQKILLVFGSILSVLLLLEICLSIGGWLFIHAQQKQNLHAIRKHGVYRIMCVGESTTATGGDSSYPNQLEKILNQAGGNIRFSVINSAVPGSDTNGILARLPKDLRLYRPHMVIAMMGINDDAWQWSKVIRAYPRTSVLSLLNGLRNLRVYRLLRLLWVSFTTRRDDPSSKPLQADWLREHEDVLPEPSAGVRRSTGDTTPATRKSIYDPEFNALMSMGVAYEKQGNHEEAIKIFKKAAAHDEKRPESYLTMGHSYRYLGNYAEAAHMLKKAISIDAGDPNAYLLLGEVYTLSNQYPEAEKQYRQAIALDSYEDRAYSGLAQIYRLQHKEQLASDCDSKAKELRLSYYNPGTRNNFLKMKEMLDTLGIRLVCVQYPARSVLQIKKIFLGRMGIIFVDNEKIFKDAVMKDGVRKYFIDMFGGDFGHCTEAGNRLLAGNIARTITRECFHAE